MRGAMINSTSAVRRIDWDAEKKELFKMHREWKQIIKIHLPREIHVDRNVCDINLLMWQAKLSV